MLLTFFFSIFHNHKLSAERDIPTYVSPYSSCGCCCRDIRWFSDVPLVRLACYSGADFFIHITGDKEAGKHLACEDSC